MVGRKDTRTKMKKRWSCLAAMGLLFVGCGDDEAGAGSGSSGLESSGSAETTGQTVTSGDVEHTGSTGGSVGRSAVAVDADVLFWQLVHGETEDFAGTIAALEGAVEHDSGDVYARAHLGWAHFLAFQQGVPSGLIEPAELVPHLSAAEEHFALAAEMAPEEPRIRGFLGYTRRALPTFAEMFDAELFGQGMADVVASNMMWPEWGLFGSVYTPDSLFAYDTPEFANVLETYWAWLDTCAGETVDRSNPDWTPYLGGETQTGRRRACWNGWVTPYNVEGAFLVIGDALVKAGDTQTAAVLYNNATLLDSYDSWPYADLLEDRIANIDVNVERFRAAVEPGTPLDPTETTVSNTSSVCLVCHGGPGYQAYAMPPWVGASADQHVVPEF